MRTKTPLLDPDSYRGGGVPEEWGRGGCHPIKILPPTSYYKTKVWLLSEREEGREKLGNEDCFECKSACKKNLATDCKSAPARGGIFRI